VRYALWVQGCPFGLHRTGIAANEGGSEIEIMQLASEILQVSSLALTTGIEPVFQPLQGENDVTNTVHNGTMFNK